MLRRMKFLMALVVAIVAGVAGASVVMGSTDPSVPPGPAALQPDGTGAVLAATASDPDGGAARGATPARWAVRVYRSETGATCPDVNRTVGGDFGRVDGDGSFHPLALDSAGACVDLTAQNPYELVLRHMPATGERGARAIVFGVATAGVASITLTVDGAVQDVPVANGAFVAPLTEDEVGEAAVTVTLADGTQETHALHADASTANRP
jgi:hypothetical protein